MTRVAAIVETDPRSRKAVVLSACRGVTDALLDLVALSERQDPAAEDRVAELRSRHAGIASELLDEAGRDEYLSGLDADLRDLAGILQTVRLLRSASTTVRDLVAGYGEIWSTRLFARLLKRRARSGEVRWVDARQVLLVEWGPMGPGVRWEASREQLMAALPATFDGIAVITGFVASDTNGLPTTLGRNGSDYSASIFGALLDADEIVHLDRRRRRPERRPAPGARSHHHR